MLRHRVFSFTVIAIFYVAVSVGAGPKFVEEPGIPEGKALVYIYCQKAYLRSSVDADVLANEEHVGVLSQGTYFPYITKPGMINFAAVQRSTNVMLAVEAGHEYFIRIGTGTKRWEFAMVHREQAMGEITACELPNSVAE